MTNHSNTIDLDEVDYITARRRRINAIDIRKATFVQGDKVIHVSTKAREDFRFTGLSTIDFVLAGFLE